MKEVKDIKNADKIIESVTKKTNKGVINGTLIGVSMSAGIFAILAISLGLSQSVLSLIYQALACGALTVGLVGGVSLLKDKIDVVKLKKVFEEVKVQTGVELDIESAEKALEKTVLKTNSSYNEEKTHDIEEREIIKRFYMLDKKEQLQVLEVVRKTVKDYMGKTTSQTLSVYEDEDKRVIDYVGEKKELKFIPKTPTIKKD